VKFLCRKNKGLWRGKNSSCRQKG